MPSYTVLLALLVTLAVPVFTQAVEVHGMQLQLGDLVPEFGSFEAHLESLQKSEEESPANVLIKYLVPPPVSEEFIEVFKSVKDATVNEEGNKDYYLLKPITDNVSYYIYGRWTSGEAYKEHLKSDHTKKLLEFDFKKGVVFTIQPLLVVD
ncbi:hypothetical protein ABBQ32_012774 [Trebouxia sp. C0010 RCD-2024]